MVAAATTTASQAFNLSAIEGNDLRTSMAWVLAAASYPSDNTQVSQAYTLSAVSTANTIYTSQVWVLAAARGAVTDPHIRVWTFTLDGHDYYVIRLGNDRTLVYDNLMKQWYHWSSGDSPTWKAYSGTTWQGADSISGAYGSNVIVGDDANGSIYFLSMDGTKDDSSNEGGTAQPFTREAYVQLPLHGYSSQRCFDAAVLGSIGELTSEDVGTVTLSYSDDRGHSYADAGSQTLSPEGYNDRVLWRSLGSIRYPGRIFKVTDEGALKRLDTLDVTIQGQTNA